MKNKENEERETRKTGNKKKTQWHPAKNYLHVPYTTDLKNSC
jgi:hypothetical protein